MRLFSFELLTTVALVAKQYMKLMRPVILGLSGAKVLTLRALIDVQLDRDEEALGRATQDDRAALEDTVILLRSMRDQLDVALIVRDSVIPVPF